MLVPCCSAYVRYGKLVNIILSLKYLSSEYIKLLILFELITGDRSLFQRPKTITLKEVHCANVLHPRPFSFIQFPCALILRFCEKACLIVWAFSRRMLLNIWICTVAHLYSLSKKFWYWGNFVTRTKQHILSVVLAMLCIVPSLL